METQQMAMPAEMAASGPSPEEMAVYDQMRQQISPQEFSNEMLAGASQVDPQAVAEFTQELQGLDIPPEALDALNDAVDEILANPQQYQQLRGEYIEQGLPEDILPEQFDPQFFAALNMAIDQLIAAPSGVQAFAKGGIAELKPIAKAIASYGRNGDTMLAHITPAEARMLRRRGGSGTINPDTGLPEFFLKKLWKAVTAPFRSVAKAVKKFVQSKVGRIIATVALGFFVGPAAASMLGVGSAAGVAAVSGFVGSAGSTLLAGGNLKDALKAGAIGGLTAGAGAGIMGGAGAFQAGSYTGPTTVAGQFARFKDAIGMGTAAPGGAPVVDAPAAVPGTSAAAPDLAPVPNAASPVDTATGVFDATTAPAQNLAPVETMVATPNPNYTNPPPPQGAGMFDSAKKFISEKISPSGIREAGTQDAMSAVQKQFPGVTAEQVMNAPASSVLGKAYQSAMPGVLSTYGPMAAVGLGTLGLAGGFQTKQPELTPTAQSLLDRDKDRVKIEDRPDMFYIQGLPGVKYDERGAIIGSQPWSPSATMDDVRVPAAGMSGIRSLAPTNYMPAMGSMGSGQAVAQPYNNSMMYGNVMQPPRFAYGGVASLAQGGYPRRTGQISGPGTEKSDSIPAMLSDGEFVMTAKAVRGAGKGSRRAGAKKMYELMHQLERNASRG